MENKKEFVVKIGCICIIIIISIFLILFYSQKEEENEVYDFFEIDNTKNTMDLDEKEANNIIENQINTEKIKVYITGEVNNPGVKEVEDGARIEDIIILAGGITELANISKVNLAYKLEDGQKIYIPNINEKVEEYITDENGEGIVENSNKSLGKININTSDIENLCELPGVGESLASRIIQYREENGKFKSIEDLKNVSGIGEKKFESLREYIVVK